MSEALATDEIVLRVPATAAYARVVRVGAAVVAVRQGMSFAEIDDLREAVDWAIELLLEPPATEGASIECVLRTGGGFLEVEAGRTDEAGAAASARFKKAADASNITATVDSDRGRLLVRKPVGNPGNPGNLGSPSA